MRLATFSCSSATTYLTMPKYLGTGLPTPAKSYAIDWVPILSQDVGNVASVTFADGTDGVVMDSTFDEYKWEFVDIHPHTDSAGFQFQVNAAGGSGFNETFTSAATNAYHGEDDTYVSFAYSGSYDQDQDAGYQYIQGANSGSDTNQSSGGVLHIFAPSNTTNVKQFMSWNHHDEYDQYSSIMYIGGYINTTSAIDEINFRFHTGNITGIITMYGLAK